MPKDELKELRAVLREAVKASRRSLRELENEMGIGHGNLKRLLDGDLEIRVHHLVALARQLQVHPKEFLELGFPDWPARHQLAEWMTPDRRKSARRASSPLSPEIEARLREIVREELATRQKA